MIEPYTIQAARLATSGRHILAQLDDESVIVYEAYKTAVAHFAAKNGHFGGEFSLNRMSSITPHFLWMMYRCGWDLEEVQEVVLAVRLKRSAFDEILRLAEPVDQAGQHSVDFLEAVLERRAFFQREQPLSSWQFEEWDTLPHGFAGFRQSLSVGLGERDYRTAIELFLASVRGCVTSLRRRIKGARRFFQ